MIRYLLLKNNKYDINYFMVLSIVLQVVDFLKCRLTWVLIIDKFIYLNVSIISMRKNNIYDNKNKLDSVNTCKNYESKTQYKQNKSLYNNKTSDDVYKNNDKYKNSGVYFKN